MKRKLLTQMLAEWRSNLWMVIELVVVVAVLQFIFTFFCLLWDVHSSNEGYDLDNVYVGSLQWIERESPDYQPYDSLHSYFTDRDMLLARLRDNRYVELVGVGSGNAMPYSYNFYGQRFFLAENDTTYSIVCNNRAMSPEVVRIIKLRGLNGESTEQLAAMIENGDVLLSDYDADYGMFDVDVELFRGREVFVGDSSHVAHVGALAHGMRRNDYEPLYRGVCYSKLPENEWGGLVVIRVKDGMGEAFMESLGRDDKSQGNVYVTDLKSIDRLRDKAHLQFTQMIRDFTICAVFILVVIFLGFLGTFWFRTQQRVAEIAIRKVNGATDRSIFARFISEGLLMLLLATLVTVPLLVAVVKTGVLENFGLQGMGLHIMVEGYAITILLLVVLIVLGIWAPARRAMMVNPAYALGSRG